MAHHRKAQRLLATAAALSLLLVACGDDDGSADTSTPTSATPGATGATTSTSGGGSATTAASGGACAHKGGTLTIATPAPPAAIDPVRLFGDGTVGADEVIAMYDTLMVYDNDAGTYEPRLAKSLTPNSDFSSWTLELRPNVKFGDGNPLNAAAVKASIARFTDPANASTYAGFVANITNMEVKGDLQLVFTLNEPWPGFPYLLADAPGMIADASVAAAKGKDAFGSNPTGAGAGPFELKRFAPGEEMVFSAKPDYWGGDVCLDELRFVPVTDPKAMQQSFDAKEIDAGITTDAILAAHVRDTGVDNFSSLHNAASTLLVNNKEGFPTHDVRIRQAVAAAIDVKTLDQRVRDGKGVPTSAYVAEGSTYYQGIPGPAFDQAKARSLVAAAKADGSFDGKISLLCTAAGQENAIAIAGMLEAVGFDVSTEVAATTTDMLTRVFGTGDYQLNCWGQAASDANLYPTLYQNFLSTSPGNTSGYKNPAMDAALGRLKAAKDVAEAKKALADIQAIFTETVPMVVTAAIRPAIFWSDDVKGVVMSHRLMAYFDKASVA